MSTRKQRSPTRPKHAGVAPLRAVNPAPRADFTPGNPAPDAEADRRWRAYRAAQQAEADRQYRELYAAIHGRASMTRQRWRERQDEARELSDAIDRRYHVTEDGQWRRGNDHAGDEGDEGA